MAGVPQTLQIPPPVSIQTMLYNTYLQIIGGGNAPFVGPLDALVAQGAVLSHASSVRRLRSLYTGPACRLRGNGANNAEADIAFLPDGTLDLAAAAAVAADSGGTQANWVTAYDQFLNTNATQPSASNQMQFGTTFQSRGEMGGLAASNRTLALDLQALPQPTFFSIVANQVSNAVTRVLLGTSSNSLNRFARMNSLFPQQNWGTTLIGSSILPGKHVYGFLSNGSNSQIYIDGNLNITGDAGNTQLEMSNARIGGNQSTTNNWNNTVGNTISEVIVFSSNPTTLPGWPAFVSAQKAHFGIP
jgi:hypothetical protein